MGYNKMATTGLPNLTNYISLWAPQSTRNSHARGADAWTNVVVTFSKPVADSATNVSNYSLSGGLAILRATLDSKSRRVGGAGHDPATSQSNYTLTVSGVQGYHSSANMIAPNSTVTFTSAPGAAYSTTRHRRLISPWFTH